MAVTGLKKNYRKLSLKGLAYTMRFFVHGRQTIKYTTITTTDIKTQKASTYYHIIKYM